MNYAQLEALVSRILPRYWLRHAAVALAIMAAVGVFAGVNAGAWSGAMFYVGREVRDREKLGAWDWPGLVAPVVAVALAWGLAWTAKYTLT